MKKLSLYRSLSVGMAVMMAALGICLVANLLCLFALIPVTACLWSHSVLLLAALVLLVLFLCRLRGGEQSAPMDEEAFTRGALRLMHIGFLLLFLLVLWAASFSAAIFLRG